MRARDRRVPDGKLGAAPLAGGAVAWLGLLLSAALVGYAAIAALLWIGQEKFIFYPRAALGEPVAPAGWRLEKVRIAMADGARLAGVLLHPPTARPALVIYFGGNAEEVTEYAPHVAETYGERAVLLVNYRGYGASEGRPSERALVADAMQLFDWAHARADIDGSRIAVHGRSLGAGVAVQLAAKKPVRCVVLTSPFASARDVARELYPWLPVSLLLRHPFDSAKYAPALRMPALVLFGEADTIIPKAHSERLAALWGGPVERRGFPGFGHNDIDLSPAYHEAIRAFLARHG